MSPRIDHYTVTADQESGQWLSEPVKTGTVDGAEWSAKVNKDTDAEHYDTYEAPILDDDGFATTRTETRAITVVWECGFGTYRVYLPDYPGDSSNEIEVRAASGEEAIDKSIDWVRNGAYDESPSVTVRAQLIGDDGDVLEHDSATREIQLLPHDQQPDRDTESPLCQRSHP